MRTDAGTADGRTRGMERGESKPRTRARSRLRPCRNQHAPARRGQSASRPGDGRRARNARCAAGAKRDRAGAQLWRKRPAMRSTNARAGARRGRTRRSGSARPAGSRRARSADAVGGSQGARRSAAARRSGLCGRRWSMPSRFSPATKPRSPPLWATICRRRSTKRRRIIGAISAISTPGSRCRTVPSRSRTS